MDIAESEPTDEPEGLSSLIGDIYDSALDASHWPQTLRQASRFVGVHSTAILTLDVSKNSHVLFEDHVIEPYYRDIYFGAYIKIDPFNVPKFFVEPGDLVANTDIMPMEDILRTRVYREWAQPQGIVDGLMATLERTVSCVVSVAMILREHSNEEKKRRARLVMPHFRRAALIANIVADRRAEAQTFEAALDGFRAGIFFADGGGALTHANAAGRAMLDEGAPLQLCGGRLTTSDRVVEPALLSALASAAAGDRAMGTRGVALSLASPQEGRHSDPHVAHILPLGDGARREAGRTFGATTAVFVQPASLDFVPPPVGLARAFGLTIAETRVLVAIVEIGGVPAVADALGLAEATIKVHLKSIYRKTGATRHADLVKLVAGFASPFGDAHGHC